MGASGPADQGGRRADRLPTRYRLARARLAYRLERYARPDELVTVAEASALLGLSREAIALLVLRGRLAVADEVRPAGQPRPPRLLLRAEVEALPRRGAGASAP